MPTFTAAALVTMAFMAAHLLGNSAHPALMLGIAVPAIPLVWLRIRWRSIYPSIALHATFNGTAMLMLGWSMMSR